MAGEPCALEFRGFVPFQRPLCPTPVFILPCPKTKRRERDRPYFLPSLFNKENSCEAYACLRTLHLCPLSLASHFTQNSVPSVSAMGARARACARTTIIRRSALHCPSHTHTHSLDPFRFPPSLSWS